MGGEGMANNQTTVLHDFHIENNANMALFAGYDMPLWYKTGTRSEHLAVIQSAGIFDTSHMAVVTVRGDGARELLQFCFTKDLEQCTGRDKGPLVDGRCVYGLFLKSDGTVIDDAIVYQFGLQNYMVVVNAGMGQEIANHLQASSGQTVHIVDWSDRLGKMDIQGPASARVLGKVLQHPEETLGGMLYFSFRGNLPGAQGKNPVLFKDNTEVLLSRTGYTGEFGFELYMARENLPLIWSELLRAGEEFGLIACGLAARDSLRAGAMLPLSHQDIGGWPFLNNPWLFALPYTEDQSGFSKEFIGADGLVKSNWDKYTLGFAGFDPRKIAAGETSYVTDESGEKIGTILTCTTDMAIGRIGNEIHSLAGSTHFEPKGLSCGFVMLDKKIDNGEVVLLTDGKRKVKVEIRDDIRPNRTARRAVKTMLD